MAYFKITLIFQGEGRGWTESYILNGIGNNHANQVTAVEKLARARANLLSKPAYIKGYRISLDGTGPDALLSYTQFLPKTVDVPTVGEVALAAAADPDQVLLIRCSNGTMSKHRFIYLRGIPDAVEVNFGKYNKDSVWGLLMLQFSKVLTVGVWGWQGVDDVNSLKKKPIATVVENPNGQTVFTFQQAIFPNAMPVGTLTKIRVSGVNKKSPAANGVHIVRKVSNTEAITENVLASGVYHFGGKGSYTPTEFVTIENMEDQKIVTRETVAALLEFTWTPTGAGAGLVHYNPCGHAVDWGRRCYSTTARFFRNSDMEVGIKWYPADPEKGPLPFPSKVCSLDWMGEKHTKEGVGEVWNTPRPFRNIRVTALIDGNHICGTEDEFRNGELLDLSRPLTKYSPSGIPLCCDPNRREANVRVGIIINTSYISEREYQSPIRVAIVITSSTRRSDPYTTSSRVSFRFTSSTQRSEPYRSRLLIALDVRTETEDEEAYFGGSLLAILIGTHYTSSVACWMLTADWPETPLTQTDHECEVELPFYGDGVPLFPSGWRRYEVEPDTDYEFKWRFNDGEGAGGEYFVYRGTDDGPSALVDNQMFVGESGSVEFDSLGFNRVFVRFVEIESDTSDDELIIEVQTL